MKPLLSALLVLAHCGPVVDSSKGVACVSRCGLMLLKPVTKSWDCESFQATEDRALRMFKSHVVAPEYRLSNGCGSKLTGYYVTEHYAYSWVDDWGRLVLGLTSCNERTIEVGWLAPQAGSLTHEIAHALQDCKPLPDPQDKDADGMHDNWWRDGIYEAISDEKDVP